MLSALVLRAGFTLWNASVASGWQGEMPWLAHTWIDVAAWLPFFESCQQGLIPYVDFSREYPVGAGALYCLMGQTLTEVVWRSEVLVIHGLWIAAFEALNASLLYRILKPQGERRAFWFTLGFLVIPTALLLSTVRFESVLATTILAGVYFHRRGRPYLATLCWSLGCLLKWIPAFFVVAQEYRARFVEGRRGQWWRSAGLLALVFALGNLPFVMLALVKYGDVTHWWSTYWFHISRPLYWDTLLGVWALWFGEVAIEAYAAYWSLALVVVALLVRPSMRVEVRCVLVCIAMIVFNRVYSPQFHLWFYPFLVVILAEQRGRTLIGLVGLTLVLDLCNVLVYPFAFAGAYDELAGEFALQRAMELGGVWTVVLSGAVVLRTGLLIALATMLYRLPGPGSESGGERPGVSPDD